MVVILLSYCCRRCSMQTAREIKKKQKMLSKYQSGGKSFLGGVGAASMKSSKNLDGSDDDDDEDDD